jgi:hypothetical protein
MENDMDNNKTKLSAESLKNVTGGIGLKDRYVSSFYCEYCGKTIKLNMVSSLERAKKEHNEKVHPQLKTNGK